MQTLLLRSVVAVVTGAALVSSAAIAGEQCNNSCRSCCHAKCRPCCALLPHRCCLTPGEPPRGEVAFSVPGVVNDERALRVSEASMERAMKRQAAEDFRRETAAEDAETGACETRIDQIEADLKELDRRLDRITVALEVLAARQKR